VEGTAEPQEHDIADTDDVVIDLTDEAMARRALYERIVSTDASGELVIDLRDETLAEAGAGGASGRPQSLLDGHRVEHVAEDGPLWDLAENFVYDHYVNLGYTDENTAHRVAELQRWADCSRFHAVVDAEDRIVGTVRTIFGAYEELPVAQFERTDHRDGNPVCELSSLVVHPTLRSTGVIEHLYRAGWLDAWRSGSQAIVALIDDWLFDAFRGTYHLPFRKIGVQKHYMGSDPVPVAMPLQGEAYLPMARTNPHFWAWTLEAVASTEIADWGLPIVITDEVLATQEAAIRAEAERRARTAADATQASTD
jgi:hypothetical protein